MGTGHSSTAKRGSTKNDSSKETGRKFDSYHLPFTKKKKQSKLARHLSLNKNDNDCRPQRPLPIDYTQNTFTQMPPLKPRAKRTPDTFIRDATVGSAVYANTRFADGDFCLESSAGAARVDPIYSDSKININLENDYDLSDRTTEVNPMYQDSKFSNKADDKNICSVVNRKINNGFNLSDNQMLYKSPIVEDIYAEVKPNTMLHRPSNDSSSEDKSSTSVFEDASDDLSGIYNVPEILRHVSKGVDSETNAASVNCGEVIELDKSISEYHEIRNNEDDSVTENKSVQVTKSTTESVPVAKNKRAPVSKNTIFETVQPTVVSVTPKKIQIVQQVVEKSTKKIPTTAKVLNIKTAKRCKPKTKLPSHPKKLSPKSQQAHHVQKTQTLENKVDIKCVKKNTEETHSKRNEISNGHHTTQKNELEKAKELKNKSSQDILPVRENMSKSKENHCISQNVLEIQNVDPVHEVNQKLDKLPTPSLPLTTEDTTSKHVIADTAVPLQLLSDVGTPATSVKNDCNTEIKFSNKKENNLIDPTLNNAIVKIEDVISCTSKADQDPQHSIKNDFSKLCDKMENQTTSSLNTEIAKGIKNTQMVFAETHAPDTYAKTEYFEFEGIKCTSKQQNKNNDKDSSQKTENTKIKDVGTTVYSSPHQHTPAPSTQKEHFTENEICNKLQQKKKMEDISAALFSSSYLDGARQSLTKSSETFVASLGLSDLNKKYSKVAEDLCNLLADSCHDDFLSSLDDIVDHQVHQTEKPTETRSCRSISEVNTETSQVSLSGSKPEKTSLTFTPSSESETNSASLAPSTHTDNVSQKIPPSTVTSPQLTPKNNLENASPILAASALTTNMSELVSASTHDTSRVASASNGRCNENTESDTAISKRDDSLKQNAEILNCSDQHVVPIGRQSLSSSSSSGKKNLISVNDSSSNGSGSTSDMSDDVWEDDETSHKDLVSANEIKTKLVEDLIKSSEVNLGDFQQFLEIPTSLSKKYHYLPIDELLQRNLEIGVNIDDLGRCLRVLAKYGLDLMKPEAERQVFSKQIVIGDNLFHADFRNMPGVIDILKCFGYEEQEDVFVFTENNDDDDPISLAVWVIEMLLAAHEFNYYNLGIHPQPQLFDVYFNNTSD